LKRAPSVLILISVLLLSSVPVASAQVQTRVRVIRASNAGTIIDPSLRDVHNELGSLFNFTSYRLLKDLRLSLVGNRPVEVMVHPGRSLEMTLVGQYRNTVELRIRVKREGKAILNTQVRLASRRTILIGGPRHGEDVLILAISASF
jgi:hypothetical protein